MRHLYKSIAIAVLLAAPFAVQAQTSDEVTAQLLAQIAQLQARIAGGTQNATNPTTGGNCVALTRSLSRGDAGTDVSDLQRFLVDERLLDAGSVTGTFGPRTEASVKEWQRAHGIDPTGTVGPRTRAAMADCGGLPGTPTTNQCTPAAKPTSCANAVEVRLGGCVVGWQCSEATLPTQTFNASPKAGPAPLVVRFTGVVTSASPGFCPGNFCAATLVFGDGSTGAVPLPNAQNASVTYDIAHTYPGAGNFVAMLYGGAWSESIPRIGNPISISVTGTTVATTTPPVATTPTLIANPISGAAPLSITFIVSNLTNPAGYTVDFGDGTYGTLITIGNSSVGATHSYTSAGSYSAKLRLPNANGGACVGQNCTVVSITAITVVGGIGGDASLAASPNNGLAPLPVIFGANGGNNAYPGGVMLDYGDGSTDVVCNPGALCGPKTLTHTFSAAGTFEVQLIGIGSGSNVLLKKVPVTVTAIVSTTLTAAPSSGAAPLEVTFTGHGGNNTYVNGVIIKYGDETQEEFCAPNTQCGQKTKTHTYTTGNPYSAQLIGMATGTASTTIGTATVNVTGGPTKLVVKSPNAAIRKGETTQLSWSVSGTRPTGVTIAFALYTQAGTRVGTILSITNFQSGNASWKVPSIADTGCTQTQPNGLCGVNLIPGVYTIRPEATGISLGGDALVATSFEIKDGTINPGAFTITTSPNSVEVGRDVQLKYRVANPPYNSAVALWLVKPSGEQVGLIDVKLDADTELTTYPWTTGRFQNCPQAIFNQNLACSQIARAALEPGQYHILGKVYSPFTANPLVASSTADVTFHAAATSTVFTLKAPNSGSCVVLTRNLGPGDRDAETGGEVTKLQQFLAEDTEIYPEGTISGFYGNATRRAVERFQAASGIRTSGSPETNGYGAVGPSTRAAIAAKCGQSSVNFKATPTAGKAPLLVTFTASAGDEQAYSIDFGDGSNGSMSVSGGGATRSVTHVYQTTGIYVAKLTDNTGKTLGAATVTVTNSTVTPPSQCAAITRTLAYEDRDADTGGDVSRLQQYLATNPTLYPEGSVTGFFGHATEAAVRRYQAQEGLPQTGNVGPQTLEKIRCDKTTAGGTFSATPQTGGAPLTVRFSTNQAVSSGSYRIVFGDGATEWMTATTVAHVYATGGTYTAQLVQSIGNCYSLTGDALRICEIGNTSVLGTITITVGQAANAFSLTASPSSLANGAPLTINWTSQGAPSGSKVRLEVYPDGTAPAPSNNDHGLTSGTRILPTTGSFTWTIPAAGGPVVADAGWGGYNLVPGNYRIHGKLYSGNECWGYCLQGDTRQVHATGQSGVFTITGGTPTTGLPVFSWSSAGTLAGKYCTNIVESAEPSSHTWGDNFFCADRHVGMQWGTSGPIPGMRCTLVNEPADTHTWNDNYLCVPSTSNFYFNWSYAGPLSGQTCTQWTESSDPDGWSDNYMCVSTTQTPAPTTLSGSINCTVRSGYNQMIRVRFGESQSRDYVIGTGEGFQRTITDTFPAAPTVVTAFHGSGGVNSAWIESTTLTGTVTANSIAISSEDAFDNDYNDLVCTVTW